MKCPQWGCLPVLNPDKREVLLFNCGGGECYLVNCLTSESLPFPGKKNCHFAKERVKHLLIHSISSVIILVPGQCLFSETLKLPYFFALKILSQLNIGWTHDCGNLRIQQMVSFFPIRSLPFFPLHPRTNHALLEWVTREPISDWVLCCPRSNTAPSW